MRAVFLPSDVHGTAAAPPSKSMAHRALICGAFSRGSKIIGVSNSEDMQATLSCLKTLGADIMRRGDRVTLGGLRPNGGILDCRESGSTLRFLLPAALLSTMPVILTGRPRLMERGVGVYREICAQKGLYFAQDDQGITVQGPLQSGVYDLPGNVSSQFISGLMFVLPLLKGDSVIRVHGKFESASYVLMTIEVLQLFDIEIRQDGQDFRIRGGQRYEGRQLQVEGDWSNAAFLSAMGARVIGLNPNSTQGDRVYPQLFDQIGKTQIDLSDCPDLAPVLFALAALRGGGRFSGTARLRIKESDRAMAMKEELEKFGVTTEVYDNEVRIRGTAHAPSALLCGHNDHRIVMALSVLCAKFGGEIEGAQAVKKSFPNFFEVIKTLDVQVKVSET